MDIKKKKKAADKGGGNWRGFFRLLGQIDLPWLVMGFSFVVELVYSKVTLALPTTTASLMSGSLEDSALHDAVIYYITLAIVITAEMFILGYACRMAVRNARTKIWGGMTRVRMDYYDSHTPTALTSAVTNDLEDAVRLLARLIITLLPELYYLVSATLTISEYDPLLVVAILVPLPLQYLYSRVIGRWTYKAQAGIFGRIGQLTGYLAERVKNLPLIKQFCTEPEELKNGKAASKDLFDANIDAIKVDCATTGFGAVISVVQQLAIILFGVILLQMGRIDMTQWIAFFLFSSNIYGKISSLVSTWLSLKSIQGQAARAVELAEAPKEQTEAEARAAALEDSSQGPSPSVVFDHVSFSYGEKPALKDVSFTVPAGTATAIVGLTGSGKTTSLNLLERFYEVDQGRVLLGDQDVKTMSLSQLRGRFSYVQQDAGVFSGTVREALTYGIRRSVSDQELIDAARSAGAWDFVEKMPGQLDAAIAADGSSLSGGQRQRLVLAREFLRNADVLLLDEPTSALDAKTAQAVEETIFRMFGGKTILMVTHDMSLVSQMDQIIVLKEGRLVGRGTRAELLESCPLFREMVEAQQREEASAQ